MNIQKKIQRFFRVHGHSAGGFTLVELIVVIAILAILAGVAIPAYSGYIKKAERAGDETLLASFNTAFAAACAMNGVDHIGLDAKNVVVTRTSAEGGNAFTVNVKTVEGFTADFETFYEGGVFKVYGNLVYKTEDGVFEGEEGEATVTITFAGKEYQIKQNSVTAFLAATVFSENVEQMQGQVDTLAGAYGDIVSNFGGAQLAGFGEDYAKYMEEVGAIGDPTKLGNATVQYVASKSADMTAQDAMDNLCNAAFYLQTNTDGEYDLMDVLEAADASGDPLTTAAMMYGAVTAYANGNPNDPAAAALKTQAEGVNNAATLLKLFQSAAGNQGFVNYCGSYTYDLNVGVTSTTPSDQFVTDMNGYLGALDTINTVSDGVNIGEEDVWSSIDVESILGQLD